MDGATSWGQDWQGLKDPSVLPAQLSLDPLHSFEGHMYPQETNRHGTHSPTPSARAAPPLWTHPHDTQRPVSPKSPRFSMPQPKSPPPPQVSLHAKAVSTQTSQDPSTWTQTSLVLMKTGWKPKRPSFWDSHRVSPETACAEQVLVSLEPQHHVFP